MLSLSSYLIRDWCDKLQHRVYLFLLLQKIARCPAVLQAEVVMCSSGKILTFSKLFIESLITIILSSVVLGIYKRNMYNAINIFPGHYREAALINAAGFLINHLF